MNIYKILRFAILAFVVTGILIASLFLAEYVTNNGTAKNIVSQFGYFGVFTIAIIAGFNLLIPVPAATFVPIFIAAGLWMPLIILTLVVGTTIADAIGFFIGRWSKEFAEEHYPKTYARMLLLNERHHSLILPFVFVYFVIAPFPNEAILIPLALIGVQFRKILIPLFVGNLISQTAFAYGVTNVFALLF